VGRIKTYDEDVVIQSALDCFWKNGYENTSVRQLEKEMGINQFSIYASFKSKSNLYQIVLKKYIDKLNKSYLSKLSKDDSTIIDVERFLIKFGTDMITKKIPGGCLMVSSILNYNKFNKNIQSVIDEFVDLMSIHFKNALENSKEKGLININSSIKKEVKYLLGTTQSISVMHQHMTIRELKDYVKNSIKKIN